MCAIWGWMTLRSCVSHEFWSSMALCSAKSKNRNQWTCNSVKIMLQNLPKPPTRTPFWRNTFQYQWNATFHTVFFQYSFFFSQTVVYDWRIQYLKANKKAVQWNQPDTHLTWKKKLKDHFFILMDELSYCSVMNAKIIVKTLLFIMS